MDEPIRFNGESIREILLSHVNHVSSINGTRYFSNNQGKRFYSDDNLLDMKKKLYLDLKEARVNLPAGLETRTYIVDRMDDIGIRPCGGVTFFYKCKSGKPTEFSVVPLDFKIPNGLDDFIESFETYQQNRLAMEVRRELVSTRRKLEHAHKDTGGPNSRRSKSKKVKLDLSIPD